VDAALEGAVYVADTSAAGTDGADTARVTGGATAFGSPRLDAGSTALAASVAGAGSLALGRSGAGAGRAGAKLKLLLEGNVAFTNEDAILTALVARWHISPPDARKHIGAITVDPPGSRAEVDLLTDVACAKAAGDVSSHARVTVKGRDADTLDLIASATGAPGATLASTLTLMGGSMGGSSLGGSGLSTVSMGGSLTGSVKAKLGDGAIDPRDVSFELRPSGERRTLGQGSFATVYPGRLHHAPPSAGVTIPEKGLDVAIKVPRSDDGTSEAAMKAFWDEIKRQVGGAGGGGGRGRGPAWCCQPAACAPEGGGVHTQCPTLPACTRHSAACAHLAPPWLRA
jgi:hypothetical protein